MQKDKQPLGDVEARIRGYLSEDQGQEYWGSLPEQQELVVMNMMDQAASDPHFMTKLEALEQINITFDVKATLSDDDGVQHKNGGEGYFRVEATPAEFGQPDFSILDRSLEGAAEFLGGYINSNAKTLNNPRGGMMPSPFVEESYLHQASFLTTLKQAGIETGEIPLLKNGLSSYKLVDQGNIAEIEPGEAVYTGFTVGFQEVAPAIEDVAPAMKIKNSLDM